MKTDTSALLSKARRTAQVWHACIYCNLSDVIDALKNIFIAPTLPHNYAPILSNSAVTCIYMTALFRGIYN